ncbi:uncharacterized protein PV07_03491 [Cladophialophora immunda]|uniref:Uncharacterized protein n=1 Tax=Cladophialophora immunda TaxID=569365 RepID=A0A0D2CL42_9EURO|nr:uncharacterized protein PV07_03491 [Cladophialophora immunda]KIW31903.1 hypothetical protein PV07_03491 [Cladophialophora immunda]OQU98373.1 hypothetical protein CLAIMM_04169 [Cladophialophora immunda]
MGLTAETIVGIIALLVMCTPSLPFLWRYLRRERLPSGNGPSMHHSISTSAQHQLQSLPGQSFIPLPYVTGIEVQASALRFQYVSTDWTHHHAQLSSLENGTLYTSRNMRLRENIVLRSGL